MKFYKKIVSKLTAILLMVGIFFSCSSKLEENSDSDIDWSKIDLSNIENLYAQPLPVIKKVVEGQSVDEYGRIKNEGLVKQSLAGLKSDAAYQAVRAELAAILQKECPTARERYRAASLFEAYKRILEIEFDCCI